MARTKQTARKSAAPAPPTSDAGGTAAGAGRDGWTYYDDSAVHHPQPTLPPEVNSSAYLVSYEQCPDTEAEGEASPGDQR